MTSQIKPCNYVLGVETMENFFTYVQESPYLKEYVDPKRKGKKYVNIFEEVDLDQAVKELNKAAEKWTFNATELSDLGPYFDLHAEHKSNQSPEYIFHYKLKKEHTPVEAMTYIMNNPINAECSVGMTIFILYCLWKYLGNKKFNKLHPFFVIKSISVNINPIIQLLFRTKTFGHMEPCNIQSQKENLKSLSPGSYCYIRGSMGWYNFITSRNRYNQKTIEINRQGENLLYMGNNKFLGFWRQDAFDPKYKGDAAAFVTQEYDDILDSLMVNGKRTLLESVDNHRHLYRRYMVYYLDETDNISLDSKSTHIDQNKINAYIEKVFRECREFDDPKLKIIYNPFDVMGIDGFSDMYLDLDVLDNLDKVMEEQTHYRALVEGVLKAYRRGFIDIRNTNVLQVAMDNLEREYPMFGLVDYQRHKYFSLAGWDDNVPNLKDHELINFPICLGRVPDGDRNLSDTEFYPWDTTKKVKTES